MSNIPTVDATVEPGAQTSRGPRKATWSEPRQVLAPEVMAGKWTFPAPQDRARPNVVPDDQTALPHWKRLLDLGCIGLSLPVILPLMGLLALLVKCVSRGPVLFRQERVGYRGRRFACLKFRTMEVGASTRVHEEYWRRLVATDSPMKKLDDDEDHRIIPFGPVLRSTGLDELPQLLNVVRGQMSLVGPRPCLPSEYEAYLPEQRRRFDAVPGLTGLWQVSGKNTTTFARMIELDVEYARTQCLALDLSILVRTVPVVLQAAGKALRRRLSKLKLLSPNPWRDDRSPAGEA